MATCVKKPFCRLDFLVLLYQVAVAQLNIYDRNFKFIDQPLEISILGTVKDLFGQYLNLRLPNNKKYKPTFVMFSCATATQDKST